MPRHICTNFTHMKCSKRWILVHGLLFGDGPSICMDITILNFFDFPIYIAYGTSLVPNRIRHLCKDFEKLHCPYLVYEVSSQWFNHYFEMWLIKCFWRIGVLNTKPCVLQTSALTIELWRNVDFHLQQISCESCIIMSTMHVHAVQCYSCIMLVFSSLSKPVYRV